MAIKKSVKKAPIKKLAVKKSPAKTVPVKKNDSVKYTSMLAAYRAFWRRGYNEWAGTSSRSEYWLSWLANVVACCLFVLFSVIAIFVDNALFGGAGVFTIVLTASFFLFVICALVPAISMLTRRMHDAGLSAWFWLLYLFSFVPLIGSYIWCISILVIALLPTKTVDNPYHKFNK